MRAIVVRLLHKHEEAVPQ